MTEQQKLPTLAALRAVPQVDAKSFNSTKRRFRSLSFNKVKRRARSSLSLSHVVQMFVFFVVLLPSTIVIDFIFMTSDGSEEHAFFLSPIEKMQIQFLD